MWISIVEYSRVFCSLLARWRLNLQKCSETGICMLCTFWLGNLLRAATAWTSQLPRVVGDRQFLTLLTWKCALRHNGVRFFDISTPKAARPRHFLTLLTWKRPSRHNGVQFFVGCDLFWDFFPVFFLGFFSRFLGLDGFHCVLQASSLNCIVLLHVGPQKVVVSQAMLHAKTQHLPPKQNDNTYCHQQGYRQKHLFCQYIYIYIVSGPWPVTVARFRAPFVARRILLKFRPAYPHSATNISLIKCFGKKHERNFWAQFGARRKAEKSTICCTT